MVKRLILILGLVSLSACTTTGGSYCDIAEPIYPTGEDINVISDSLVTQILTHNETWGELCD